MPKKLTPLKKAAPKKSVASKKKVEPNKKAQSKTSVEKSKKSPPKPKNLKVQPTEISIFGDMYECMYLDISRDQFEELASIGAGEEEDLILEDSEAWMELEDRIMDDSKINGFIFDSSSANFTVSADSKEQVECVENFIKENSSIFSSKPPVSPKKKTKSYYLIFEKWCKKGLKSVTIKTKFDSSKLRLISDDCVLPTGKIRVVADLSYGVEDLDFKESFTVREELYVYSSDGKRFNLET